MTKCMQIWRKIMGYYLVLYGCCTNTVYTIEDNYSELLFHGTLDNRYNKWSYVCISRIPDTELLNTANDWSSYIHCIIWSKHGTNKKGIFFPWNHFLKLFHGKVTWRDAQSVTLLFQSQRLHIFFFAYRYPPRSFTSKTYHLLMFFFLGTKHKVMRWTLSII